MCSVFVNIFGRVKLVYALVCVPRAAKLRHYANPPAGLSLPNACVLSELMRFAFVLNSVKRLSARLQKCVLMLLLVIFFIPVVVHSPANMELNKRAMKL